MLCLVVKISFVVKKPLLVDTSETLQRKTHKKDTKPKLIINRFTFILQVRFLIGNHKNVLYKQTSLYVCALIFSSENIAIAMVDI